MKSRQLIPILSLGLVASAALATAEAVRPVNPETSVEARALLQVLYDISGKYTLTGQHNYPNARARNSEFVQRYLGETPAVYSQDFGFAEDGDKDSYLARPDIVDEVKRQHRLGSLIALCWHAVPPTADEPVVFSRGPGGGTAPSGDLASVQGQLTDEQFRDVLTPGTPLHERWTQQVDVIAGFLQQLEDANVPVLWRPYHEMNGNWFWWGARVGEHSTAALYRQIYDRLVNHHGLDNLVWVWSVDRPGDNSLDFESVYPGDEYVDVVSLDVYGRDFAQSYYEDLVALAKGKPLVLGEVGNPPTPEILGRQPGWTMWVVWAGMARGTSRAEYETLLDDPRVLSLEDEAYWNAIAPLREAAGLPADDSRLIHRDEDGNRVDFSGFWLIDEEKSDQGGPGAPAHILEINQRGDTLVVKRTRLSEYEDGDVTRETVRLDGSESHSTFMGAPKVTTAGWGKDGGAIEIESTVTFNFGGNEMKIPSSESWSLLLGGHYLTIERTSTSPRGKTTSTAVYERR